MTFEAGIAFTVTIVRIELTIPFVVFKSDAFALLAFNNKTLLYPEQLLWAFYISERRSL